MTKSFKKLTIATFAGVFLLSFGLTLVMDVRSVYGLGANYFDDDGGNPENCDVYDRNGVNDICGKTEMLLMVGETQYVRQTGGNLRLYFKNRRGQLTIHNPHWCPNNSFGDLVETEDHDQDVAIGEEVTRIVIPGEPDVIGERRQAGTAACSSKVQITFKANQLKDGGADGVGLPGLWYADIRLRHMDAAPGRYDGIQNALQFQLSSGDGFQYDPSNDRMIAPLGKRHSQDLDPGFDIRGHGITVEQKNGPANYGLKIRFGTDCDVTSFLDTFIWFYDLDGVGVSGGAQQNGNIKLQLRRINANTGRDEWLRQGTTNDWDDGLNGPNNNWNDNGADAAHTINAPTQANEDWRWPFRAHPGYKYELRILNIYSNNTIQVSPPFDGAYGPLDCDYPSVRLEPTNRWSVSGHLEPGETAVYISRLNNLSSDKTGYVDDAHGRVWLDGGDKRFDGDGVDGDRVLRNNDDYINGKTAVGPAGRRLSSDQQFTANADYSYLCGQLFNIDASPPPDIETIILALPSPACIPIGKYPALVARGGDVRAGGAVPPSTQSVCQLDHIPDLIEPVDLTALRIQGHLYDDAVLGAGNNANRFKGSYAALAALSPGEIIEFGSMNGFYRGPGTSTSHGLFGTRSWSGATYTREGFFLAQDASLSTNTHCLPDVEALYPAPTTRVELDPANPNSRYGIRNSRTYVFPTGGNRTLTLCSAAAAGVSSPCTSTGGVTLTPGSRTTIRVTQEGNATTNTVVIDGSVIYPAATTSYASIAELPQLTIVADKRINIRFADETTVYSGLVATKGNLYTCEGHDGGAAITTNACKDKALTINGVTIVGGKLYPFRTDGFNTRVNTSFAENFTLTPEALLSDYAHAQQQLKLRVDYQTGLPPRF